MKKRLFPHPILRTRLIISALVIFSALVFLVTPLAAQTFTVLYMFQGGTDGQNPLGNPVLDPSGNFYGVTQRGGTYNQGTIFKLDASGIETTLYSFGAGSEGSAPFAGLLRDAGGNLYGTTTAGGPFGEGVVYELDSSNNMTVIHGFGTKGHKDAGDSWAELIGGPGGIMYGTTIGGGSAYHGTVFAVNRKGNERVLYSFSALNGVTPKARLLRDPAGNLYGTTSDGGAFHDGTVFKLDSSGNETVLHSFNGDDGHNPRAGLISDPAGNLYGTTENGGKIPCSGFQDWGCGLVFKIDTSGNYTVVYKFGYDYCGGSPTSALVRDPQGNLYASAGNIIKLDPSGNCTVLHTFNGNDGSSPSQLIRDAAGNLYGTTYYGGIETDACADGCGVIFKISF